MGVARQTYVVEVVGSVAVSVVVKTTAGPLPMKCAVDVCRFAQLPQSTNTVAVSVSVHIVFTGPKVKCIGTGCVIVQSSALDVEDSAVFVSLRAAA